jgi:hypothetical protein
MGIYTLLGSLIFKEAMLINKGTLQSYPLHFTKYHWVIRRCLVFPTHIVECMKESAGLPDERYVGIISIDIAF